MNGVECDYRNTCVFREFSHVLAVVCLAIVFLVGLRRAPEFHQDRSVGKEDAFFRSTRAPFQLAQAKVIFMSQCHVTKSKHVFTETGAALVVCDSLWRSRGRQSPQPVHSKQKNDLAEFVEDSQAAV